VSASGIYGSALARSLEIYHPLRDLNEANARHIIAAGYSGMFFPESGTPMISNIFIIVIEHQATIAVN
jgi:hypothetical protein